MTFTTGHAQYTIYALIDPRDHSIRYIGIAVDVQKRYYEHLHGLCNKSVRQWIKELRKLDTSPVLHMLEIVNRQAGTSFEEFMRVVCDKEADWIDAYIRLGTPLLNRDGITKRYRRAFGKPRKSIREQTVAATGFLPQVVPSTTIVASTANFPVMKTFALKLQS